MLMNLQPQPMPGAVKESNAPALANLRWKTTLAEELLNCLVNCHSIHSRFDLFQSERLPGFYCFPKLSLRIARAPAENGPRHVAEISGLRVARENIQDNQRVRVKRTEAALMRIAGLVAARDDRAGRNSTCAQDGGVNFCTQHFRGQRFAAPAQSFSGSRFRRFQNFNRAFQSCFRNPQRATDHFNFLLRFRFAFGPEKSICRPNADLIRHEFLRITERKIRRNDCRSYAPFSEKMCKNFFVRWRLLRFPLHFTLQLAEHDEFVRFGLLAPAIDFQIAQDKCALAILLEKNERIGREKLGRVKHVWIGLAGGDDKQGGFVVSSTHSVFALHLRSLFVLIPPITIGTADISSRLFLLITRPT